MVLASICALSRNRVIGKDNQLPWRLKGDLAFFRQKTLGKIVIMGRSTWESIGRPLPGRRIAVLSRGAHPPDQDDSVRWFSQVEDVLEYASAEEEVMVAGGALIFERFMPLLGVQYLTEIEAEVEGDTFYPEYERSEWREQERVAGPPDSLPYSFVTYINVR